MPQDIKMQLPKNIEEVLSNIEASIDKKKKARDFFGYMLFGLETGHEDENYDTLLPVILTYYQQAMERRISLLHKIYSENPQLETQERAKKMENYYVEVALNSI